MKFMKKYGILFVLSLTSIFAKANIQNDIVPERWSDIKDHTDGILKSFFVGVEYRVKAGIAVGGTSPLPVPLEIQEIKSFKPSLNISLEAEIVKTFSQYWGLSFGLRLETKGMETDARVKTYQLRMLSPDGGEVEGAFTGFVKTRVANSYISLPALAMWKPSERWEIKLGPYVSYLYSGDFSGSAYGGYLREGSPIGPKLEIPEAKYEFAENLRRWNWGAQLGADWRAFPHLLVGIDLTWGMNSIFKKNFEVMTFDMYPIFLNLNFGYAF